MIVAIVSPEIRIDGESGHEDKYSIDYKRRAILVSLELCFDMIKKSDEKCCHCLPSVKQVFSAPFNIFFYSSTILFDYHIKTFDYFVNLCKLFVNTERIFSLIQLSLLTVVYRKKNIQRHYQLIKFSAK